MIRLPFGSIAVSYAKFRNLASNASQQRRNTINRISSAPKFVRQYAKFNPLQNKQILESLIRNTASTSADNTLSSVIQEEISRRKLIEKRQQKGKTGDALKIDNEEAREITYDHLAFERALDNKPALRSSPDELQKLWDDQKYQEIVSITDRVIAERKWETPVESLSVFDSVEDKTKAQDIYALSMRFKIYLMRAAALARLERAEEAIQAADYLLTADKSESFREISIIKAISLSKLAKFDEAVACLDRVIEAESSQPSSAPISDNSMASKALSYLDEEEIDEFEEVKTQVQFQRSPRAQKRLSSSGAPSQATGCDKEPYLIKAQIMLYANRLAEVLANCELALKARPTGASTEASQNAKAFNLMATASKMKQDYTAAVKNANSALSLDAALLQAHMTKAQSFVGLGEMDLALKTLDSAARSMPHVPTPLLMKGVLLMILGQHQQSLDTFNNLLSLERTMKQQSKGSLRATILSHKCRILVALKRIPEAESVIAEAMSLAPTDASVLSDSARVKLLTGKFVEALATIQAAESVFAEKRNRQNNRSARSDLAVMKAGVLSKLSRFSEGLQAAKEAVDLNPSSTSALLILGRLQERSNELQDAIQTFSNAEKVAQGSDAVAALAGLAAVYTKLGDEQKAKEYFAKAAMLNPELRAKMESMIQMPNTSKPSDFTPA